MPSSGNEKKGMGLKHMRSYANMTLRVRIIFSIKLWLESEINFLINNHSPALPAIRMTCREAAKSQEKWSCLILAQTYSLYSFQLPATQKKSPLLIIKHNFYRHTNNKMLSFLWKSSKIHFQKANQRMLISCNPFKWHFE